MRHPRWLSSLLVVLSALLGACGSGGGSDVYVPPTDEPSEPAGPRALPTPYEDELLNTLYALGVPLEDLDSPRVEADGSVRSANYMPLGSTVVMLRPPELLCAGFRVADPDLGTVEDGVLIERVVHDPPVPDNLALVHTLADRRWVSSPIRRSVGADLDGDGVEEVTIVHRPTGGALTIEVIQQVDGVYTRTVLHEVTRIAGSSIRDVDLGAGDVDGDDREELLVAVSQADGAGQLLCFAFGSSGPVERTEWGKSWSVSAGRNLVVLVEAGNADDDHGCEVGVVLNESWLQAGRETGAASYRIYDDASTLLAELRAGPVDVTTNLLGGGEQTVPAVYANLAFCDVDADRVAEVVLAGLRYFQPPNQDDSNYLLLIALEDGDGGFARLSEHASSLVFRPIGNEEDQEYRVVHHVWIEPLDIDGDTHQEFLVNHLVYENFADSPKPWTVLRDFSADVFLPVDTVYPLTRRTCAVAVGDIDEDGKDEVLHIAPQAGTRLDRIDVWRATGNAEMIPVQNLPDPFSDSAVDLMLVATDIDGDGIVLQAVPNSHTVVYTEPIVIAALAGPPCKFGIGQNLDACSTSYGRSTTSSATNSGSLLQKVSYAVGWSPKNPIVSGEIMAKLEVELKETFGFTQSTSVSTTYTTGPLEDTVIFTTVPHDRYEYRVLHHKQTSRKNTRYYVMNPREPVTLMVQREFFNDVTSPDSVKIDGSVFRHTIGDPTTYHDRASKDQIVAAAPRSQPAYENGAQRVGQGTGSVELGLAIGVERNFDFELEVMGSIEVEVSAGAKVQWSVGFGLGYSLSLSWGTEMSYVGTVGNIDAEHFVDQQYAFGIFTHYHTDAASGQTFEVVDYWVED